jgi:chemotaxis signal transduction protein
MSDVSTVMTGEGAEIGGLIGQMQGGQMAADTRQFVIFHVKDEMFAVPLAEVKEIIRMPGVVRMPLSPASLEGLANLRGTVLPVVNLRNVLASRRSRTTTPRAWWCSIRGARSGWWSIAWPMW